MYFCAFVNSYRFCTECEENWLCVSRHLPFSLKFRFGRQSAHKKKVVGVLKAHEVQNAQVRLCMPVYGFSR